jgi:hypothetical protein
MEHSVHDWQNYVDTSSCKAGSHSIHSARLDLAHVAENNLSVRSDSWRPWRRSRLPLQALGRSGSAMSDQPNDPGTGLAHSRLGLGVWDIGTE